ncbi:ADAM17 [Mytilus coruscus]|uniref:ADAM17 n=1 Tax=Mytilus coruscus TaxID=42192 RepID=A0A6J8CY92_MYTCO|nr:ADAM17 [Mytilus coruscus]
MKISMIVMENVCGSLLAQPKVCGSLLAQPKVFGSLLAQPKVCGSLLAQPKVCGSLLAQPKVCGSLLAQPKVCGSLLAQPKSVVGELLLSKKIYNIFLNLFTGSSFDCPPGANKALGTSCLDGGQCDGSGNCQAYCEARGLQSCVCGDIGDSCKRCCKDTTATSPTCSAINQTAFHQDGRPCTGTCINSDPSYISRFFDLIDQISFDFIAEAFKTNMVAFIQVFSFLIWVPLSCVVLCKDKRSQKWSRNELNIKKRENRNLMVDQDGRPIKRPAKKMRSDNPYLSMEPRSLSGRPYSSRALSTKPGKSQKNKVKPNRRRRDENHLSMSRELDGDSVA